MEGKKEKGFDVFIRRMIFEYTVWVIIIWRILMLWMNLLSDRRERKLAMAHISNLKAQK